MNTLSFGKIGLGMLSVCLLATGCGSGSSSSSSSSSLVSDARAQEVVDHYATLAFAMYSDAHDEAVVLRDAIEDFVENPTEGNLTLAKTAWKNARETYGPTEAWRGWGGPIEGDDTSLSGGELEGLINAWPMDEAQIDYIDGDATAGLINATATEVSTDEIIAANGDTDDDVMLGWHAIEFLLWGQDLDANGPGARAATDYDSILPTVIAEDGVPFSRIRAFIEQEKQTHDGLTWRDIILHEEQIFGALSDSTTSTDKELRRSFYLLLAAEMLVEHIELVRDDWDPAGSGNFYDTLQATNPRVALGWIMRGMEFLSGDELPIERIAVAMQIAEDESEATQTNGNSGNGKGDASGDQRSQELEHSCFSDNTHRDIYLNAHGIEVLYKGIWDDPNGNDNDIASAAGNSLKDLLTEFNTAVATDVNSKLTAAMASVQAVSDRATAGVEEPFDKQVLDGNTDGRAVLQSAVDDLQALGSAITSAGTALEITIQGR